MAVIVQEMVHPIVSGVSFSRNPTTGLDEIVVEAIQGSGEALVQEGVTPGRWMYKWGEWIDRPEEGAIGLDLIEEVVGGTRAIAKAYGQPVDLEWVYDGRHIHWVQLREITSLGVSVYSNRISKEVFPGIIKPLVWSVNVPLVNGAWVRLFTELIGPNDIDPNSLAKSFYYRAYFNMGAIGEIFEMLGLPREALELLMGIERGGSERPSFKPTPRTYSLFPRMLRVALEKLRFERRIEAFLPAIRQRYEALRGEPLDELGEKELIARIDRLYELTQEAAYYNIVTPLLMQMYNRALTSQLSRLEVDSERFDLTGDMPELEQFDPNPHLAELGREYRALDEGVRARVLASSCDEFRELPGIDQFRAAVDQFVGRFGHLSDSGNDFSSVPWREAPGLILKMIANYTPPDERPRDTLQLRDLRVSPIEGPWLKWTHGKARRFRLHREAVSSLYTFGYGLFRDHFLALGDHFVRRGILVSRGDIFYLHLGEVKEIVAGILTGADAQDRVARRKREIRECEDIVPPSVIYGDRPIPPAARTGSRLRGTPTSRGYYAGPVRVVRGLRDFDRLREGDILVVPYSDVGWTPLFTRAGAVIAESGGILSHSSIIAREYGIPAVVSVPGACQLEDNTMVTVDGYRGEITIHGPTVG